MFYTNNSQTLRHRSCRLYVQPLQLSGGEALASVTCLKNGTVVSKCNNSHITTRKKLVRVRYKVTINNQRKYTPLSQLQYLGCVSTEQA